MENTFDQTAVETIDLLEARLRRIEYAVCGQVDESALSSTKTTATQRLAALEHSLHQLASKSRVVQDLLRLRKPSATYPWILYLTFRRVQISGFISISKYERPTYHIRH